MLGGVFIKNITKYVGNKIKTLRESKNITQQELAEYLGTTQQSIARYESGERKADQNVLFSLSKYFSVPIDDFFPEHQNENNYLDEVQLLFDKAKPHLSKDDEETIKFIMNKTIKNYEENKKE